MDFMTNKKSIWAFVLAFMLVVPAMFLFSACGKHKHSFSSEWSQSETQHWHTCTGKNCDEKQDLADHEFVWVEKTPAGVHVNKVEEGTCSTCNFKMDRTVPNTATHSYETASWEKDETGHWHKSTCDATDPAHQGLKNDFAEHAYGAWTVKTPAEFHKNRVDHRLCSVCGFEDTKEVPESMEHTWEYKYDNQNHWEETTCAGHDKLIRNKEAHTTKWQILNNQEHQLLTDCEEHGLYSIKTGNHRYDNVDDTTCNDCGYVRTLSDKGSFNALSAKTYNAGAQGVASSDYTVNEAIKDLCEIQYKVKGANDSTYTTTAPTNAGTYEVRIFCRGNATYLKGEVAKTEFVINQIEVPVNSFFKLEKQTTSENYITLKTYEFTDAGLPSNVTLTLRAYGEKYKNQGRYKILKENDAFEGLQFDNTNFKPIPTYRATPQKSVGIVVYVNETPVVTGTNQTDYNVSWIDFVASPYVIIKNFTITSGTLQIGDYLICEGINVPLRLIDVELNKGSSGSEQCSGIAFAGEIVNIRFAIEGFITKEIAKTKLINTTFTKVDYAVLAFSEGSNTTNSMNVTLEQNKSMYLEFTATVDSAKTFKLNFDYDGGYRAGESFEFYNAETGEKMTNTLNEVSVSAAGTYKIVIKITKVAAEYNYLKKTVPFSVTIK